MSMETSAVGAAILSKGHSLKEQQYSKKKLVGFDNNQIRLEFSRALRCGAAGCERGELS
jgi:hypothetical protein